MKTIFNNPKSIIIAIVFVFLLFPAAKPAEAGCWNQCTKYSMCPSGTKLYAVAIGLQFPVAVCYPNYLELEPWYQSPTNTQCYLWHFNGNLSACCGSSCPSIPYADVVNQAKAYCNQPTCDPTSIFCFNPQPPCNWFKVIADYNNLSANPGDYCTSYVEVCNGDCNNNIRNACTTPTASIWQGENATHWTWYCPGKNGGSNSGQCQFPKPVPVDGACSSPANHLAPCAPGTQASLVTSADKWTWGCNGDNGGVNTSPAACVETNCAATHCTNEQCTNTSGTVWGTKVPIWGSKICTKDTNIVCTTDDCGSTISIPYTGCYEPSTNGCPGRSCNISDCPAPESKPCPSCPINPGTWREVSPQN